MKAAILIGHLKNPGNEGSLIRTAEAFGISIVFVIGKKKSYSSSKGLERHMLFKEFKDIEEFIIYCKTNNHRIVSIENGVGASKIDEVIYPINPVFVTGHEDTGVPADILKNSSRIVNIPQSNSYGRCLNTTVASSIVINDWFKSRGQYEKI